MSDHSSAVLTAEVRFGSGCPSTKSTAVDMIGNSLILAGKKSFHQLQPYDS
jgi:hypothetical protein